MKIGKYSQKCPEIQLNSKEGIDRTIFTCFWTFEEKGRPKPAPQKFHSHLQVRMGGFFSSESQDPEMLKLATQYKVRKVNNVTIVSISQTTTIIMNMIFALFRCPCRTPNSWRSTSAAWTGMGRDFSPGDNPVNYVHDSNEMTVLQKIRMITMMILMTGTTLPSLSLRRRASTLWWTRSP